MYIKNSSPDVYNFDTGALIILISEAMFTSTKLSSRFDLLLSPELRRLRKQKLEEIGITFYKSTVNIGNIVICETAAAEFKKIVIYSGGPLEKTRYEELMPLIKVTPDREDSRLKSLPRSRKISDNDITIFGTGKQCGLTTITTDKRFVTACKQKGVMIDAVILPPMSLTGL